MPLKKLQLKPGVNRENTRYTVKAAGTPATKFVFAKAHPKRLVAGSGYRQITTTAYAALFGSGQPLRVFHTSALGPTQSITLPTAVRTMTSHLLFQLSH